MSDIEWGGTLSGDGEIRYYATDGTVARHAGRDGAAHQRCPCGCGENRAVAADLAALEAELEARTMPRRALAWLDEHVTVRHEYGG